MSAPSTFLGQVFIRQLFAFAGYSLLVYDYLLTLSLEVAHIWNEPWTLVKVLFLINRYGNLIGQTFIAMEESGHLSHGSRRFCMGFQLFATLFTVFSGQSVRIFVVMRACAIATRRRSITLLINGLYVMYALALFGLSSYLLLRFVDVSEFLYLDEVGICAVSLSNHRTWTLGFIPLILDSGMLAITCLSLYRSTRESYGTSPSPLVRLLARDALLFYIATLFNDIFYIICWTVLRQDPRNFLPALITYPLLSVVGQRLVLNLRRYRTRLDSTRDLSREINRQLEAMVHVGFEMDQLGTEPAPG